MYQMNEYEIVKVHGGDLTPYHFVWEFSAKMKRGNFLISVWLFPGLMGAANVLSLMEPTKRVDFLHILENISFL